MRVPIPERFNLRPALLFTLFVFLGQQAAGTDIVFSLLTVAYIALFVTGFNQAGGLLYPSGGFIFFNGLLTAIFGLVYKIFLFEPGEKTLMNGNKTMLVYCGGMLSMAVAAGLNRRLRPKHGLLGTLPTDSRMNHIALAYLLFGIFLSFFSFSSEEGSVGSALRQINHFIPMAVVMGATYKYHRTGGRKGANWIVYAAGLIILAEGLLSFSKEGFFLGPLTWVITVLALGYSFTLRQIAAYALGAFLVVYYLVPYSQYVRGFRATTASENLAVATKYLSNLSETRELYLASRENHDITGEPHFYSTPQGFFDRLTMLAFDDDLINYTDEGNVFGLLPTVYSYANIVPHFIWKEKPVFSYGNVYAREIGALPDEDVTTGISFSPTGDAYHQATWLGVLVVWPVVVFLFFLVTDSLTGSTRQAPWALLPITLASHQAPEGLMSGTIFLTTYGVVALVFLAFFAKYLVPVATDLMRGGRSATEPSPGLGAEIAVPRRL